MRALRETRAVAARDYENGRRVGTRCGYSPGFRDAVFYRN